MEPNFILDVLRTMFTLFDWVVYQTLILIYEIFFSVAQQEIFSDATIMNFFDRVFVIIGIFMLFKLAISLLGAVVNPDTLTDKEKGMGNIVTRIIIVMILLVALMPLDIPNVPSQEIATEEEKKSYNYKLNTHGLLFGTLYTLQDRILESNVLGKLVLGSSTSDTNAQNDEMAEAGKKLSGTVYRAFLYPKEECKNPPDGYDTWNDENAEPSELIGLVNYTCMSKKTGEIIYGYNYSFIISTIVGGVLLFIIVGFTLDIAIRSVKLSMLRLLAPIPIISSIDPKSAKNGAFAAWTKTLTSTFLDLFLRLIIIYVGIFAANELTKNFPTIVGDNYFIQAVVLVFMILGVFFFVKQAPKFFKDMFGLSGQGSGMGVGLSGLLGGTAAALGGGGLAGFGYGAMQGANMANDAAAQGKAAPSAWSTMSNQMARIRTGDKDAQGGMLGKLQDRLNYNIRERQAGKYGIGKNDLADAEYSKDMAQNAANVADENLAMAEARMNSAPSLSDIDMNAYQNPDGSWKSEHAEAAYYKQRDAINLERAQRQEEFLEARRAKQSADVALSKAAKNVDTMENRRGQMGTSPRIEDEYRVTYRSKSQKTQNEDGTYSYSPKLKTTGRVDDDSFSSTGHGSSGPSGGPPSH